MPTVGDGTIAQSSSAPAVQPEHQLEWAIQFTLVFYLPMALVLSFLMPVLPEDIRGIYSDFGSSILNGVAVILGIIALSKVKEPEFKKVGIGVTLYLALYLLASVIWDIYDLVLGQDPFPSPADIPWILAYVPLIYIFVTTLIKYNEYSNPSKTLVIYMIMFFAAIIIFIPLATVIISTDSPMLDKAITLAYPVLDLFLLILIAQLVSIYWMGKLGMYWTFILTAIIFELTADIIYTYDSNYEIYFAGSMSDSFFFMASFCFIFVFVIVLLAKKYNTRYGIEPEGKYAIRHVFLVYPNGLLITHLTTPGTNIIDVEIFTGMLTAVQSFIKESFQMGEASGGLDRLRYRSLEIAIERGDNVFLAVVVDGRVTDQLHAKMHAVIAHVQEKYGAKLKDWDGDLAHIDGVKEVVGLIFQR
jgi:hypothetical protein